jgi:3-phenylpropionate/cinnamic acid dioxygenase small subunit
MSETAEATAPAAAARLPRDARYYDTKREIEEFLYDEANLLDERRFEEWLATLADDLRYFMPMEYNVKFGEHAQRELTKREQQMSWFNEGKWSIGKRVEQILTGVHWAEEPLSRVCRMVSNVQLKAIETNAGGEEEVDVSSRFLIYQNRCEYEQYFFVGDRFDVFELSVDRRRHVPATFSGDLKRDPGAPGHGAADQATDSGAARLP